MLKSWSDAITLIQVKVYWWNLDTYLSDDLLMELASAHGRHWELNVLPQDTNWQ